MRLSQVDNEARSKCTSNESSTAEFFIQYSSVNKKLFLLQFDYSLFVIALIPCSLPTSLYFTFSMKYLINAVKSLYVFMKFNAVIRLYSSFPELFPHRIHLVLYIIYLVMISLPHLFLILFIFSLYLVNIGRFGLSLHLVDSLLGLDAMNC